MSFISDVHQQSIYLDEIFRRLHRLLNVDMSGSQRRYRP